MMYLYSVLLLVMQLVALGLSEVSNQSDIISYLLRDYDRSTGPMEITGEPLTVEINLFVNRIGPFEEAEMSLGLRTAIRMTWNDPRLAFEDEQVSVLRLPGLFSHEIWIPDLYFPEAKVFSLVSHVKENSFIRISKDGTILMSFDAEMAVDCPMALHSFPFDRQICSFVMESYGYTTDDLVLLWKPEHPVEASLQIELNQFRVAEINQSQYVQLFSTGSFSGLRVIITLDRTLLYFFLHLYFPATVIVFISWVALWVPRGYTALRLGTGVAALLSMLVVCNMGNAAKNGVSTITAADCFLALCFIQVFGALVTCLCQNLCCNCCSGRNTDGDDDDEEEDKTSAFSTDNKRSTPLCDKIFGTIFPATFVLLIALSVFYA